MTETTAAPQSAEDFAALLTTALDALAFVHPDDLPCDLSDLAEALDGARVGSFAEGGYLTRDAGLTVRVGDAEFQITVVAR
jgi:hypothetical protein